MTLDAMIIGAGGFVFVLPFLGFPAQWDTVFLVLVGLFIVGLGIAVRRRGGNAAARQGTSRTYAESAPARDARKDVLSLTEKKDIHEIP